MNPPPRQYTGEELISDLQRVADIVDRTPTMAEYDEDGGLVEQPPLEISRVDDGERRLRRLAGEDSPF